MATLSRDTLPEAEEVMIRILSDMPAWRRLQLLEDACDAARELARVGLKRRCPEASDSEVDRLLFDLLLGEELAEKAFGPRRR